MSREAAHRVTSGVTLAARIAFAARPGGAYLLVGMGILALLCCQSVARWLRDARRDDSKGLRLALAAARPSDFEHDQVAFFV